MNAPGGEANSLVSVIMPCHNGSATIAETLLSVCTQTYRALEIIVVDDGSNDNSREIVQRFAEQDARIHLVSTSNNGVASARNTAIQASKGDFIAPIDADDLWHPTRIEQQMKAFQSEGPSTALVYSPCRIIDENSRIVNTEPLFGMKGNLLFRHLWVNPVGNGSGILVRKDVVKEMGGYATWMRELGAEGCEDFFLQIQIAARYHIGLVPEYLVGYRRTPGSMSSKTLPMLRSRIYAIEAAAKRCPHLPGLPFRIAALRFEATLIKELLRTAGLAAACTELAIRSRKGPLLATCMPLLVIKAAWKMALRTVTRHRRPLAQPVPSQQLRGKSFHDTGATDHPEPIASGVHRAAISLCGWLDRRYGIEPGYGGAPAKLHAEWPPSAPTFGARRPEISCAEPRHAGTLR